MDIACFPAGAAPAPCSAAPSLDGQAALGRSTAKTVYIAGPMAGLPDDNYPAFFAAEERLSAAGWRVVNPARFAAVFGKEPTGKVLDALCAAECTATPLPEADFLPLMP